jgi:hypothetical protein
LYDHYSSGSSNSSPSAMPSSRASRSSTRGMAPQNKADLAVKPLSYRVPLNVPRQVSNQVVWDVLKLFSAITIPTSGIVETNFPFFLSQHPQVSSWTALFDQWCIPQATVSFQSEIPPGSTANPAVFVTALDFDNVANVGSLSALEDFSTASVDQMSAARVVTRSIHPCVKLRSGATDSSAVTRQWIDCASPAIAWYGVRSIGGVSSATYTVIAVTTIWFCFRNQI